MADGMEEYDASRAEQWHRSAKDLLAALSELYIGRGWGSESFRLDPGRRLRRWTPAPSTDGDSVRARVADRLPALTLTLGETASEDRALPRPPSRAREVRIPPVHGSVLESVLRSSWPVGRRLFGRKQPFERPERRAQPL